MDKVAVGVPVYADQSSQWWGPLVMQAANFHYQNIELVDVIPLRGMMVDVQRNYIVDDFLSTDAEWLRWLDADNVDKIGSIRRQLDTQKTLVTGLYMKRNDKGEPLAYFSTHDGEYTPAGNFHPGEIIPIDAAGMGGCLVHRSVFEDIKKNFRMFDMARGGIITVHKDDIQGDVFDDAMDVTDERVVDGTYRLRLRQPKKKKPFAFFVLGFGRTEDYGFFEMAKRAGHQLWLDTGVEIGHIGEHNFTPEEVRQREIKELQRRYYEAVPI